MNDYSAATSKSADMKKAFFASMNAVQVKDYPYRHWLVFDIFPVEIAEQLANLPFPVPDIGGISGQRDLHNATRQYFDRDNIQKYLLCKEVAEHFQSKSTIESLQNTFGIDLAGTYLRLEYAQDTDGFWLEPHTDLGVKKFTMLIYLSDGEGHDQLGTDIYSAKDAHVGRSVFQRNAAMVFIPADNTWHGFEKRTIKGVRKSLILNYVTPEWRAREQLAYPDSLITR
ncbi:MAG: 2OG-Fe(II) oxygenase [Hyphomicrobiales bacterium]